MERGFVELSLRFPYGLFGKAHVWSQEGFFIWKKNMGFRSTKPYSVPSHVLVLKVREVSPQKCGTIMSIP